MPTHTRAARALIAGFSDFQTGIEDSESDPFVVQQLLREQGKIMTGKKGTAYEWKLATGRGTVDAMSPEARADFTPVNPGVNLSLTNKGYKTADLVHEIDEKECSGRQGIFDLIENRLLWMPEAVGRGFNTDFYLDGTQTTYGTNAIIGAAGAIISSGTYAGQNVGTETALAGQVSSAAPHTTFSTDPFPSLTTAFLSCYRGTEAGAGQYKPTHCLMDVTNFSYILNAANDLRTTLQVEEKFGTQAVTFMGVKCIMDRFAVAARLFVLNMKYLEVHTPFDKFMQTRRQEQISPLSVSLLCFFYGKLVFKLPRAFARITTA